MVKELIKDPEQLSKRSKEWEVLKNQPLSIELVQALCDTLAEHNELLWLTANQLGYEERAFAIKFTEETEVFFNPSIQNKDKMILYREKDYITGKEYIIPRFTEISLAFQDCLGKTRGFKLNEAASIIVCQAMDMINGVFTSDYGLEVLPEFDAATDEEKSEVLAEYLKQLEETYKHADEMLSNNEETKKTWNTAKFIKGIADGDVELEQKPLSNRKKRKLEKFLKRLKGKKGK